MHESGSHDDDILSSTVLRPIPWRTFRRAVWGAVALYAMDGLVGLPLLVVLGERARMPGLLVVIASVTLAVALGLALLLSTVPHVLRRAPNAVALAGITAPGVLVTLVVVGYGPSFAVGTAFYAQAAVFACALLRLRWAVASIALIGAEAGVVLAVQGGWVAPAAQWLIIVAGAAGISVTAGLLTARVVELAESEKRARTELAELNETLQHRVEAQVAQLEQANRLKRFLSPQVADAVLAGDHANVLAAHRRKVAVFFCDLRGFTSFTSRVEPEDVIDVLGEYYRVVGEVLHDYDATVGSFAGDGIFAFLNDPAPCDDPAAAAVAMAAEIRGRMRPLIGGWRELGYDLGVGIGVAAGHATLGLVGYEGRQDYTALGTVVNLAARLCDAAADGQILVDLRTATELPDDVATEPVDGVALKGFPAEMRILTVG